MSWTFGGAVAARTGAFGAGRGGDHASDTDGVWHLPRGGSKARHVVKGLDTALGLAWHGGEL